MINTLIFDFDGTILDTEAPWYYSYRDLYEKHEVDLPLKLFEQVIGSTFANFNPFDYLVERTGMMLDEAELRAYTVERHAFYMQAQQIRPGVIDYLEAAKAAGMKRAIASSSSREWVEGYAVKLGIRDYFQEIVTSDDVEIVKPNPALYLTALSRLGSVADEAIAIEDSRNGMLAANAAGIRCVVVPNDVTSDMDFTECQLQLNSLADQSLEEIVRQLLIA
mgnify:CR=1 FL=1